MSNTSRYIKPGWGPNHPLWQMCEESDPERFDVRSTKHHTRDRRSFGRHDRFQKGVKNSRHNLLLKNEVLALREKMDEL